MPAFILALLAALGTWLPRIAGAILTLSVVPAAAQVAGSVAQATNSATPALSHGLSDAAEGAGGAIKGAGQSATGLSELFQGEGKWVLIGLGALLYVMRR